MQTHMTSEHNGHVCVNFKLLNIYKEKNGLFRKRTKE